MSWQDYVDNQLVASGCIQKAAIAGLDGAPWTSSPNFDVAKEEVAKVVAGFRNEEMLRSGGFTLAGQHYTVASVTDEMVIGIFGKGGVVCVKTAQTIVIGVCEPDQRGDAINKVYGFGDYLKAQGY